MGLKLYKIISRPPKVFRQYVFDEIPDNDFLQKSFDIRDTFFGTPGSLGVKFQTSSTPPSDTFWRGVVLVLVTGVNKVNS